MNLTQRKAIYGFVLLIILFLAMVFWPFVFSTILQPVALVLWLFLRLFVLGFDQQYYWAILIFSIVFFVIRLLPRNLAINQPEESYISNETLASINSWRHQFIPGDNLANDDLAIRREYAHMLVLFYATRLHTQPDFLLYDALRAGDIPLPAHIHDLAFFEEPRQKKTTLRGLFQSIINTPRRWIYRWTGQDKADHYRMIDEFLSFMESSLEMKNDNENFTFHQH